MKQPVLVVLDLHDGDTRTKRELGELLEDTLNGYGLLHKWHVQWAVPLSYTLEVPEGAIHG